jgi:phage gp45-like
MNMHRATPLNSSIRGYTAGGSRSVVDQVDDTKLMQEMSGNFMINETRSGVEAPQNYGFTSVVFNAEKDSSGKIAASAETFVSFLGGNRSLPVTGNMDDRRHRMYKLQQGDTAMFRGRGDSPVVMSSTMPSAKYSCSGSPLMF